MYRDQSCKNKVVIENIIKYKLKKEDLMRLPKNPFKQLYLKLHKNLIKGDNIK